MKEEETRFERRISLTAHPGSLRDVLTTGNACFRPSSLVPASQPFSYVEASVVSLLLSRSSQSSSRSFSSRITRLRCAKENDDRCAEAAFAFDYQEEQYDPLRREGLPLMRIILSKGMCGPIKAPDDLRTRVGAELKCS